MSQGTYANMADVVSNDFVKQQCPESFAALEKTFEDAGIDFNDFFMAQYQDCDYTNIEDDFDEQLIDTAYDVLKEDFNKVTGLTLYTVYHYAEDRGDELDGGAFQVEGVYQYTPAGEKFSKEIERKTWTTWD